MGRYQRVKSDGEFGECEGELEGKAIESHGNQNARIECRCFIRHLGACIN